MNHPFKPTLSWSILVALVAYPLPVLPATIEVNETCTLVDAINTANNDDDSGGLCPPGGSGADTLVLTSNVTLDAVASTAYEETGLPVVTSEITVEGGGFVVERDPNAPSFRIFALAGSGTLTLNDVAIRNGGGHGLRQGGSIWVVDASVHLDLVTVTEGDAGYGGAIFVERGELTMRRSTVSRCGAGVGAGVYGVDSTIDVSESALFDNRGGIGGAMTLIDSVTTLSNSTLTANGASTGAGVQVEGGSLTVVDSSLSDNLGYSLGGAIWSVYSDAVITNSTLSGNRAGDYGGAILSNGDVTITNSTLSGNSVGYNGGGLTVMGVATITNSTVTGNAAYYLGGGVESLGTVKLAGSIVAGNVGGDCLLYGSIIDDGGNFDGDGSCPGAATIVPGLDFDTTLADNGGPTSTHALLEGSAALDAAGDCGLETDQRGVLRDDGACDSGSFELVEDGGCCTDGPGVESDCVVTSQSDCESGGGLFLGPGTECRPDVDCTALEVTMASMSAGAVPGGVLVRWTTALELDTVGFRVLREAAGRRAKGLEPVGPIVPASGSEVEGGSYEVLDVGPAAARAIHYYIEDVDLFSRVTRHGPIVVERGTRRGPSIRIAR